jgi:hypothetical protein
VLNGYHHWLLARLRPLGVRIYVVPRHGLFGWVACPQLLGRNFEFCGIRNNVWPAAGVGQHAGRFGISERKSQLDSQLVSAGEAADNSLTLASAHTVRLLAAPLLRSLRSFVRQRGRCLSNRREGPRRPMHQRKYPTEGNDLGLTPPGNQTDPHQDAEKRGDTSETDP